MDSRAVVGLARVEVNYIVATGESNENRAILLLWEVPGRCVTGSMELAAIITTVDGRILSSLDVLDVEGAVLSEGLDIPVLVLLVGPLLPAMDYVAVLPALVKRSPGLGILDAIGSGDDGHVELK